MLLWEKDIINEVNLIPNPVKDNTPIIREAHKIIDAINDICWPQKLHALKNLSVPVLRSNIFFKLTNKSKNEINIAMEAENCGVKPKNIKVNKVIKGMKKNINV